MGDMYNILPKNNYKFVCMSLKNNGDYYHAAHKKTLIYLGDVITDRYWIDGDITIGANVKILSIENSCIYLKYNEILANHVNLRHIDKISSADISLDDVIETIGNSYGYIKHDWGNVFLTMTYPYLIRSKNPIYFDTFYKYIVSIYEYFGYDITSEPLIKSYKIKTKMFVPSKNEIILLSGKYDLMYYNYLNNKTTEKIIKFDEVIIG